MKIGPVEGTPEEIKGFIEDNGLDVERFLQLPEKPIRAIWFVLPIIEYVCGFVCVPNVWQLSRGSLFTGDFG